MQPLQVCTVSNQSMKMHSGEKLNQCNQCNYVYSDPSTLRTHLKRREKSNKCNQCDFASSRAGDLRRHLKTHIGEKSNKCNQCDFASTQAGDLRRHLKTHMEKSQASATYLDRVPAWLVMGNLTKPTMPLLMQAIWGYIWKRTVEKSQINATNVTLHRPGQPI